MRASEQLFSSVLKHILDLQNNMKIDSDYISFVTTEGFTVRRTSLNQNSFVLQVVNVLKTHPDVQKFSNHMPWLVVAE